MIKGVWGSVRLGPRIHLKDYGLVRGIMGGVWFVKIEKGTNVRCVVCMGDGVETRFVVLMIKQMGNGKNKV